MTIENSLDVAQTGKRYHKPYSPELLVGLVLVLDVLLILLAGLLAPLLSDSTSPAASSSHTLVVMISAGFAGAVFFALGCYRQELLFSPIPRIRSILASWFVMLLVPSLVAGGIGGWTVPPDWMLWWAAGGAGLLVLGRLVLSLCLGNDTVRQAFAQRAMVIGAGELGQRLAAHLDRKPDPLVRLTGFVDERHGRVPELVSGLPVLGGIDKLVELARSGAVEQVFIALPWSAEQRIRDILDRLETLPIQIRLAPDQIGYDLTYRPTSRVAGLPFLNAVDRPISGWDSLVKDVEDKLLGLLLVLACLPVMALIAIAIRIDSPGPVLFRQTRLGFNDRPFGMFKFRSMYHDRTDADADKLTTPDDDRVTRVGRFIRRYSLDELPQLFNVLAGDMSVVGPRPHALGAKAAGRRYQQAVRNYAARHKVKPGITGWAQVSGWRGETDTLEKIEKRVEFDLYYIENWSIWLDVWILMKTAIVVFQTRNAY